LGFQIMGINSHFFGANRYILCLLLKDNTVAQKCCLIIIIIIISDTLR
jgi:hypothetical protein